MRFEQRVIDINYDLYSWRCLVATFFSFYHSSIFDVWMLSLHVWLIVLRWEFASEKFPLMTSTFSSSLSIHQWCAHRILLQVKTFPGVFTVTIHIHIYSYFQRALLFYCWTVQIQSVQILYSNYQDISFMIVLDVVLLATFFILVYIWYCAESTSHGNPVHTHIATGTYWT